MDTDMENFSFLIFSSTIMINDRSKNVEKNRKKMENFIEVFLKEEKKVKCRPYFFKNNGQFSKYYEPKYVYKYVH